MNEDQYSHWAVKDIIRNYLEGESNEQIWTIIMSLLATYYQLLEDSNDINEAINNIMDMIDEGNLEELE